MVLYRLVLLRCLSWAAVVSRASVWTRLPGFVHRHVSSSVGLALVPHLSFPAAGLVGLLLIGVGHVLCRCLT